MTIVLPLLALALPANLAANPPAGSSVAPELAGFVLEPPVEDPKPPVAHPWSGTVGLSISSSSGNTDKNSIGATGQAEERGEHDRWTAQFVWNYTDEKGVGVTERKVYGQLKYDYFINPRTFAYGLLSGESDHNAALDLRGTLGVGMGYQFREDKEWKISGEAGLSYVDENFVGSADDQDFLAARLAYKADATIGESWTAGQWGELLQSLDGADDISARVDTHARINLSAKMFAQAQWIYSWDNTPATGADRVDEQFLISLGWSF